MPELLDNKGDDSGSLQPGGGWGGADSLKAQVPKFPYRAASLSLHQIPPLKAEFRPATLKDFKNTICQTSFIQKWNKTFK